MTITKSGDVLGQASVLNNLGRLSYNLDQKDKAIENTNEAAVLYEMAGELNKAGFCKQNISKYYRKLGKEDLARQSLTEAIDLFVRAKNTSAEQESRTELKKINKRHSNPWWTWLLICVIILVIVGIIFLAFI